ncbi:MAG: TIGR02186 family protein, partial [Candidatus Latescibacterota bacterium]|jgi:uncharacterized protein (TIGR02186 family)
MHMKSVTIVLVAIMVQSLPLALMARVDGTGVAMSVDPEAINIGTFYHGTTVRVAAQTPICEGVIVTIESGEKTFILNRKARVGFLWMNVAKVTIEGAPEVYVLASSADVEAICSAKDREKLRLGVESLKGITSVSSDSPVTGEEFDEFIKLKRHTGEYNDDITIDIESGGEEMQSVTAELPLPSVTPSGSYKVSLYCFNGEKLVETATDELKIEKVGLPRLEAKLAHEHAAAYGIAAILVAMVTGITMGAIFTSRGGGGH